MTCAEHNRSHCPEPRCHVLAVCAAEIPDARDGLGAFLDFAEWGSYDIGLSVDPSDVRLVGTPRAVAVWHGQEKMAQIVATRLVAWMRARWTTRKPGPLRILVEGAVPEGVWADFGPGHYHPLDAVLPYEERVAALAKLCTKCQQHEGCHGNWCGPPVHDGINWHTVAVLLDAIQDLGIGLDVVHEWRPPS